MRFCIYKSIFCLILCYHGNEVGLFLSLSWALLPLAYVKCWHVGQTVGTSSVNGQLYQHGTVVYIAYCITVPVEEGPKSICGCLAVKRL